MSVYFARVGQYIKIGYSKNPGRRVRNLFQSGTYYSRPDDCPTDPTQRELLATISGGLDVEWQCHQALDDFAVGGEFFVDEPPVREFIAEAQAGRFPTIPRDGGPAYTPPELSPESKAVFSNLLSRVFLPADTG